MVIQPPNSRKDPLIRPSRSAMSTFPREGGRWKFCSAFSYAIALTGLRLQVETIGKFPPASLDKFLEYAAVILGVGSYVEVIIQTLAFCKNDPVASQTMCHSFFPS